MNFKVKAALFAGEIFSKWFVIYGILPILIATLFIVGVFKIGNTPSRKDQFNANLAHERAGSFKSMEGKQVGW